MTENLAETVKQQEAMHNNLLTQLVSACSDAKGKDITVLSVSKLSDLFDYIVIVSGRSDRQVQGISNRVLQLLEDSGIDPLSVEGFEKGHWVLIDCGEVVLHVFYEPVRGYYDLERLWGKGKKIEI